MKYIYITLIGALTLFVSCDADLDQFPENLPSAGAITDFGPVLNAAYFYQLATVTPMGVMGDFRADNALMMEEPFTDFDEFNLNLKSQEDQFFGPFYTAAYKSILSANNVIENSTDPSEVGQAQFLRALSYFKLVRVFGDVPINLSDTPDASDLEAFVRQPANDVYNNVIIPDLEAAIAALDNNIVDGRASRIAAQGMLGKVYLQLGDFPSAQPLLGSVVNDASAAGISLMGNFADIFTTDLNSEVIFATQVSSSVPDEYGFSEFVSWYRGLDTKSLQPLDTDLIAAFDASPGDLRREVTIIDTLLASNKYPQVEANADFDWIELRLADAILMYAEALNETGSTPAAIIELNKIRTRAGLGDTPATTQGDVRQAIADERRLELAFEGQRWFDLVRTGTVDAEMGMTIDPNYHLFPIPQSEIDATFMTITQNPGY
jgi:hypothetical protein